MIVRGIDANGDWLYGKGKNDYKKNLLCVAQNIATRLRSFYGDCFFSTEDGVDWFNLLGSKNQTALSLAVSASILNTEGVTSIVEISLTLDNNRALLMQYTVNTIYGRLYQQQVQMGAA